jgi:hypothetical protein
MQGNLVCRIWLSRRGRDAGRAGTGLISQALGLNVFPLQLDAQLSPATVSPMCLFWDFFPLEGPQSWWKM